MTVFQGIFQSEGTLEGRGPQRHKLTAGRTARSRFSVLVKGMELWDSSGFSGLFPE
ncbi:MAG: hypothetical protein PsegKO_36560 [Pseudohongiellaceae bacterium]